jgi:hypothetical protein
VAGLLLLLLLPGIPGSVEFVEGNGGLPTVMLKHACGASAQVRTTSSSSSSSKIAPAKLMMQLRRSNTGGRHATDIKPSAAVVHWCRRKG